MNYWDLSQRERSELSYEDVEKYVAYELMRQGVSKVPEPIYQDEGPEIKMPEEEMVYEVDCDHRQIAMFELQKDAISFIETLNTLSFGDTKTVSIYDYRSRKTNPKHFVPSNKDFSVTPVIVYNKSELDTIHEELTKRAAIIDSNSALRNEYEKATKEVNTHLTEMWDDWKELVETGTEYRNKKETLEEFITMCDGNEELAVKFFLKGTDMDTAREMCKWYDMDPSFLNPTEDVTEGGT
jgi:hypothetical protein